MTELIVGHLWGDYLFQNNWMALNKGKHFFPCFVHCFLYTICVCFWVCFIANNSFSWLFFGLIFLSHYPIDQFGLTQKWLNLIKGRNFIEEELSNNVGKSIRVSFSTLVYTVADNTLHFTAMYFVMKYCFGA